jgi:hypothetical protein
MLCVVSGCIGVHRVGTSDIEVLSVSSGAAVDRVIYVPYFGTACYTAGPPRGPGVELSKVSAETNSLRVERECGNDGEGDVGRDQVECGSTFKFALTRVMSTLHAHPYHLYQHSNASSSFDETE